MTWSRCSLMWRFGIVILGVFLFAIGIFMYIHWIDMFTRLRGREMALSPTSPSYSGWKSSPLPLNFDVYLFNWTNPEDFYEGSKIKPHFEELGPYRFREKPDKVDIEWHPHNYSLSFRKTATFHFDAEGSRGTLEDKITTVNTAAHAAALRVKDGTFIHKGMLEGVLRMYHEEVAVTKTADEWMFKGYLDPLVTMGSFFSKFSSDIEVPFDRVGWMYTRNDSAEYDGHFNMYTGVDDIAKMGQIHTWNYMNRSGKYEGQCDEVKGSMGEFFPPNLTTNDSISIYLPNLCRSVPLDYTETVKIHGVTAYKFAGGERAVDNGTRYPETKCACIDGKCEPAGVINISPCKYNSSVYMSYPHFYKADPVYLEAVDGLSPDKEKHEFFMTLEPNAGVVMDVGGGFQANYLMEPIKGVAPFKNVPRTFIPIMWAEERVRVTEEIARDIALVPLIVLLGQIFTGALLAGGIILICWYPTKIITRSCHDPKTKSTLLNPLSPLTTASKSITLIPHHPHAIRNKPNEGVSLLEYKNGGSIQENGDVTEGLLSHEVRPSSDIASR